MKATAEALKPWYMFMCKRPCFDDEHGPLGSFAATQHREVEVAEADHAELPRHVDAPRLRLDQHPGLPDALP